MCLNMNAATAASQDGSTFSVSPRSILVCILGSQRNSHSFKKLLLCPFAIKFQPLFGPFHFIISHVAATCRGHLT